jgi:hypothetical protein
MLTSKTAAGQACGVRWFTSREPGVGAGVNTLEDVDGLKLPDLYTDPLLELLKATRIVVEIRRAFVMGRAIRGRSAGIGITRHAGS